jgi:polyisoprenyl-phosphate glycosyltransferase
MGASAGSRTERPVVSAVVPVFRSETTLAALHERLVASLPAEHEVVFVDDASPDGSADLLAELTATDPRVRIVRHAVNRGQHAAVLTGLAEARGEAVVVLDADGQDPPEAIPALLARLAAAHEGADAPTRRGPASGVEPRADLRRPAAVFGLRRGRYEGRGRRITARVFRALLRLASGRRLPAGAGMFVALSGDLAAQLASARSADGPGPYVVGLIARSGATLDGIPVDRAPAGTTSYTRSARLAVGARALREAVRR